jgi:hypothetical protein
MKNTTQHPHSRVLLSARYLFKYLRCYYCGVKKILWVWIIGETAIVTSGPSDLSIFDNTYELNNPMRRHEYPGKNNGPEHALTLSSMLTKKHISTPLVKVVGMNMWCLCKTPPFNCFPLKCV